MREYVWDSTGRLTEVKISSSTVGAYTYNAYNQRTKKVAGTTTHYVYGAGGLLYGEYDNAGDLIREYIYLNGAPLAQINAGSPEVLTYLHTDHLGTPRFGTNTGGSQVWAWAPDAFGNGAPSGSWGKFRSICAATVVEVVMLTTAGLTSSARSAKLTGRSCACTGDMASDSAKSVRSASIASHSGPCADTGWRAITRTRGAFLES